VKFRSLDFNAFQMLNLLERVRINYLFFRDYKRGFSFGKGNFINYKIFSRISKVKKFTTTPFQWLFRKRNSLKMAMAKSLRKPKRYLRIFHPLLLNLIPPSLSETTISTKNTSKPLTNSPKTFKRPKLMAIFTVSNRSAKSSTNLSRWMIILWLISQNKAKP